MAPKFFQAATLKKNLGRFYRAPFKSLLRVQIKRATVSLSIQLPPAPKVRSANLGIQPKYCWVEAAVWLLCWVPIKNIVNSPFSRWSWQIFQNPIKVSFRLDLGQNVVLTSLFGCSNTVAEKSTKCLVFVEYDKCFRNIRAITTYNTYLKLK